MMRAGMARDAAQAAYTGTPEAFLATLGMVFRIDRARDEDLRRAEELTIRTHQLNTSGRTYSYHELSALSQSSDHLLLIAGLDDRYGSYGRVGLALVSRARQTWTIELLLMSCRVMQRGVGTVLLTHLMRLASEAGVRLRAAFVQNDRNRIMLVTYRLSGFQVVEQNGKTLTLEHDLREVPSFPDYLTVHPGM
jgi:FkbH-like protein